jgi:hypothetical protein
MDTGDPSLDRTITLLFLAMIRQGRTITNKPFGDFSKAVDSLDVKATYQRQYFALKGAREGLRAFYSNNGPEHRPDAKECDPLAIARTLSLIPDYYSVELASYAFMMNGYGQSLKKAIRHLRD